MRCRVFLRYCESISRQRQQQTVCRFTNSNSVKMTSSCSNKQVIHFVPKFSLLTQWMCRKSSLRYTKAFSTKLCRMVLRKMLYDKSKKKRERRRGKRENATQRWVKSLNAWKLDWRNHIHRRSTSSCCCSWFQKNLPILCVPTFTSYHYCAVTLWVIYVV